MEKSSTHKPSGSRGHPFLSGLMTGLVLGVAICAGVAIYIARSPSPFQNRALETIGMAKEAPVAGKSAADKPREEGANPAPSESPSGPAISDSDKPTAPVTPGNLYIQVGAFANREDAEKEIETIAQIAGVHAKLVTGGSDQSKALVRVRIGPFSQVGDTSELVQILKSNNIPIALVRPAAGEVIQ